MNIFHYFLILATFLCTIVSGFLLAFSIVVMPGIKNLSDKQFIKTFQVIDRVIQDRQPIFMLIWIGSLISIIIASILSFQEIEGYKLTLMILASIIFLVCVHIPTILINVPLNNELQSFDTLTENTNSCKTTRDKFEVKWNHWNLIRTLFSCIASVLLLIIVLLI